MEKEKRLLDLQKWFNPKHYKRLWNVGPPGALLTGLIVYTTLKIDTFLGLPLINFSDFWQKILMVLTGLEGMIILLWILFSLPPKERGIKLSKRGIYSFIRHPVYTVIIFHLPVFYALLFRSFGVLLVIPAIYIFWSKTIVREEEYLVGIFGEDYVDYMREVPRFIPWK